MQALYPILQPIVASLSGVLTDVERPVALTIVSPAGPPAHDECCDGMAYIRLVEAFPTAGAGGNNPFPTRDNLQRGPGCGVNLLSLHLALGVIRCAHTVNSDGTPPTQNEINFDASLVLADMGTVLDVIVCVVKEHPKVMKSVVGAWSPQGPSGGCVGGEWSFWVAVDPCLDCTPAPTTTTTTSTTTEE